MLLESPNRFDWDLQPSLAVEQKRSGSWLQYLIGEKERKTRDAPRSKPQKKADSVLDDVVTDPKNSTRRAWEGCVWSQKVWKVWGYCTIDWNYFSFGMINKNIYICDKCNFTICITVMFHVSMQITVHPQIRPVKKNSQLLSAENEIKSF